MKWGKVLTWLQSLFIIFTAATGKIDYRLPDTLRPVSYKLHISPNVDGDSFEGSVLILIYVEKSTKQITLHSHNLTIVDIGLSNNIKIDSYHLDAVREFLVIDLIQALQKNEFVDVSIDFAGQMKNKIVGLYKSSYITPNGKKKYLATSNFEPTYARQAFPCFDEPDMKATFHITLNFSTSEGYHGLSNMNEEETVETTSGNTLVTFEESVPMSTYLVCFIVSDFAHKTKRVDTQGIGPNFNIRIFATPHQLNKVDFAVETAVAVVEFYIQYFQVEYPLPKLDMVAIPDLADGAMENWGLVTYRETSLLYEKNVSSAENMQCVAFVIAHELAHMWFGNLVTMAWWNDLWLNEGFASYIENKGVDDRFPEWKMLDQFLVDTLHVAFSLDATLGSHPIIQTVTTPDQITEIFDTINYLKGSSIIRMLEDFVGSENFQYGVTNYLNEFQYKNAVTRNFLTHMDEFFLPFNVTEIMSTWTEQMGLPVIKVEKISPTEFKLTQNRFFSNPKDYENIYNDSPFNYTWSIPITYTTNTQSQVQRAWFYYNQNEIRIQLPAAVDWIKFNLDQIGYYRVNYAVELWQSLADNLIVNPNVFSVGDRAGLLNDAFSLADSTQLSYDIALDMTKYLSKETEYVPWSVAASKLTSLKRSLMFTNIFADYTTYARALIKPIYEEVTWQVGEEHLKNRLRVTALSAACSLGLPDCLQEASKHFKDWLSQPSKRPAPDVRETVYFYGMLESSDEQSWQQMWDLFVAEKDANEKSKLMYGLSAIQVPRILSRYVDLAWNEEYVRGQDYFTCLQYIAANPIGEPIVWEYVQKHWPDLVERFSLNYNNLGSLIPSITSHFSTNEKLEGMKYFFNKYPEAGAGTAERVNALETVKNNIVWLENNRDKIGDWLAQQTQ